MGQVQPPAAANSSRREAGEKDALFSVALLGARTGSWQRRISGRGGSGLAWRLARPAGSRGGEDRCSGSGECTAPSVTLCRSAP